MKKLIVTTIQGNMGDGPNFFLNSIERTYVHCEADMIILGDSSLGKCSFLDIQRRPLKGLETAHPVVARIGTAVDLPIEDETLVIWTDSRDVIFQGCPFKWLEQQDHFKVHVFEEDARFKVDKEATNRKWLEELFIDIPQDLVGQNILCSGFFMGPWRLMKEHLTLMARALIRAPNGFGYDQPVHNYLVRQNPQAYVIHGNDKGPVHHALLAPTGQWRSGFFHRENGTCPLILHQYDRSPSLIQPVANEYR